MKHARYLWLLLTMLLVTVSAQAQFNPTDPPEPSVPISRYTVSGSVSPGNAGYISPSSASGQAGENVTLTACANSSYVFTQWVDDNGAVVSNTARLTGKVPDHNVH